MMGRRECVDPSACDQGSLTIELAAASLLLTMCFLLLTGLLGAAHRSFVLSALARDAARAAAVQSDRASADQAVARILRGHDAVQRIVHADDGLVTVELHEDQHLFRIPNLVRVSGQATAYQEVPW